MWQRRGTRGPAPISEVNLRDVAHLAGVSPATVSRVFTGNATVREPTRERVLEAADELGYVVNRLAQSMLGTARRPLAFITAGMSDPAAAQMLAGAERVADENGHLLLAGMTGGCTDREGRLIEGLCENRVAGVLLVGATTPGPDSEARLARYAAALASVGARLILADHPYLPSLPDILTVNYDQMGGVRRVVELVARQGYGRIAFLGWNRSTTANQRFLGYSIAMKQVGMAIDSSSLVECEDDVTAAHLAALLLLNQPVPPTAIVCVSDVVATGVYRAARDLGITIPGQLAVTGFGDSGFAGDLTPGLTTVQAPFEQVGAKAAELALAVNGASQRVELPTRLVVRSSTG